MSKKKEKTNNSIKCDVESCKHNNCEEGYCELDEIKVGCTCDNDNCKDTGETVCESFATDEDVCDDCDEEYEERITDTEYEVEAEADDLDEELEKEE